jgi:hypothetical protein
MKNYDILFNKSYLVKNCLKYLNLKIANNLKSKLIDLKLQIKDITDDIINPTEKQLIIDYIVKEENKLLKRKSLIKKNEINNLKEEDLEHYIQTILIKIDDKEYLQDENGFLYENSDEHTIIGRIINNLDEENNTEINTIEWFN